MIGKLIDVIKEDISSLNQSASEEDIKMSIKLEKYLRYLENNYAFEDYEFKEFCRYISSCTNIDDATKKDIILDLGYYYWVHNDHSKEEIEIVDENNKYLDEEDIITLLKRFGFSIEFIEKLKSYKTEFEKLKKYSTLEKINSILNAFKANGINAFDFSDRARQLLLILIHSNENVVNKIFEFIKEDITMDGFSYKNELLYKSRFRDYLGHYTLFGERTRVLKKRGTKTPPNPTQSNHGFVGTFLNYRDNREFLKEIGVAIKLDSLSSLEKSPSTIKSNYYLLKKYGFTNDDIEKSLYVLSVAHLEYLIDLSIELGLFDKFKKYPSHYVGFNKLIAMRIKYCRLHNICIDGRLKDEISTKISKQSKPFEEKNGGPEVYGEASSTQVSYKVDNQEEVDRMVKEYSELMKIQKPTPLFAKMKFIDVPGDSISDIEYEYSYRKRYFENLIKRFDQVFSNGNLLYVFHKDGKNVVISRLKVHRNLLKLLYNEFTGRLNDYNFDYFSNILLYCVEKDSMITREEKMIIVDNIFSFADAINRESELARMVDGIEISDTYNSDNSIDSYRRR